MDGLLVLVPSRIHDGDRHTVLDLLSRVYAESPEALAPGQTAIGTFDRWLAGELDVLIPSIWGRMAGVYLTETCGAGVAFGHQFVLVRWRRGWNAVEFGRACLEKYLEMYPAVGNIMGIIPMENRASIAVARKLGFLERGSVDGGILMVLRRSFYGRKH